MLDGQELWLSGLSRQGSLDPDAFLPQQSPRGSVSSDLWKQFFNFSPSAASRSGFPRDEDNAGSPCLYPLNPPTILNRPEESTRNSLSRSPISLRDYSRLSLSYSNFRPDSQSPPLAPFGWCHAYGDWVGRRDSAQLHTDPIVSGLQSLIEKNNTFEGEMMHAENKHQVLVVMSEIEARQSLHESVHSCYVCQTWKYLECLRWYFHYRQSHSDTVVLSYTPDWKFWLLEAVKSVLQCYRSESAVRFDSVMILIDDCTAIQACTGIGLRHEVRALLRSCNKGFDNRQPNTISAKYLAAYLAEDLTATGQYDEAEDLLKYVLQGRFKLLETMDIEALSNVKSIEQVTLDEGDSFREMSCFDKMSCCKRMSANNVFRAAVLTLQKLRKVQSGLLVTEDLPESMKNLSSLIKGDDLDSAMNDTEMEVAS